MSYTGPKEVNYLFIDGGYLRKVIEAIGADLFGTNTPPIDYKLLAHGFTKIFYYDCLPPQGKNEDSATYKKRVKPQESFFNQLRLLPGWHVFEGVTVGKGNGARQKQVDVQISVDMLTHSYRRNMHKISFVAGDQDFKPLLDAIIREGMYIELWYEERSASKDLVFSADSRKQIDFFMLHNFLYSKYKNKYSRPRQSIQAIDRSWSPIRSGQGNHGGIKLYESKDNFILTHPYENSDESYMTTSHDDLDYLVKIYERCYGKIIWSIHK